MTIRKTSVLFNKYLFSALFKHTEQYLNKNSLLNKFICLSVNQFT